ncbi:hypothetical protein ONT16_10420 [Prevotella copri]|uniref:Uncharacterized protein n=1 Tax=Segatella copri TaxID=165179 RepID=A0AAP3BFA6_9BACT|nr:hypothetical protein [Segatella copri]MCW4128659.1 hypothetical protein [Segatella copri]
MLNYSVAELRIYKEELRIGNKILLFDDMFYRHFLSDKIYKVPQTQTKDMATGKEILSSRVWYTLGYGDDKYNEVNHFGEHSRPYDSLLRKQRKTRKGFHLWKFWNFLYD